MFIPIYCKFHLFNAIPKQLHRVLLNDCIYSVNLPVQSNECIIRSYTNFNVHNTLYCIKKNNFSRNAKSFMKNGRSLRG